MDFLLLLLYISALVSGATAIMLCLVFFLKHKKVFFLYFGGFIISLYIILIQLMSRFFVELFSLSHIKLLHSLYISLNFIAVMLFQFCGPTLSRRILGLKSGKKYYRLLSLYTSMTVLMYAAILLFPENRVLFLAYRLLTPWATTAYMLLLFALHFRRVFSIYLKSPAIAFFLLSLLHLAAALTAYSSKNLAYTIHPERFVHTIYFTLLYIGCIIVAFRYLISPPYLENGELSGYFVLMYGISKREADVLNIVLTGASNAEIADRLFISSKTVENHLTRIYHKTGTKNRFHFLSMVHSLS